MDKTITIDGKRVTFRKTGGTAMRYNMQFGRELNPDLRKIYTKISELKKIESDEDKNAAIDAFLSIETSWMYQILFTMAQQADGNITDMISWLDSFDTFNVWNVFMQLMDMLQTELTASPKNV